VLDDAILLNVPKDNVRLHFIPFALKDLAKKWMHSLDKLHFHTGWVCEVLLRKYFSNDKNVQLRNEINHFV